MTPKDLASYKQQLSKTFSFQAEVFNKPIWGDMGEDSAQISVTTDKTHWHISFIRTQSGDPSPFDDFVCNVIDEYERDLNDDELFDMLALHALLADFEAACKAFRISN